MADHWAQLLDKPTDGFQKTKRIPPCRRSDVKPLCTPKAVTSGRIGSTKKKRVHFQDEQYNSDGMGSRNGNLCHSSGAEVSQPPQTSSTLAPHREFHLFNVAPEIVGSHGVPTMSITDAKMAALKYRQSQEREVSEDQVNGTVKTSEDGIKDLDALQRHLSSIQYKVDESVKRVPWVETLSITVNRYVQEDEVIDPADDHRRESSFHDISVLGVKEALRRLSLLQVPFTRPSDFYAEMLKTDHHMHKVQVRLADQEVRIKTVENRKKQRLQKKFAKKVQAESIKQKQQEKNKNLKKVEEWKKSKYQSAL